MPTLEIQSLTIYLFFIAACCTIFVKVGLSSPYKIPSLIHLIVACLGELYIRESYPNDYPV